MLISTQLVSRLIFMFLRRFDLEKFCLQGHMSAGFHPTIAFALLNISNIERELLMFRRTVERK